MCGGSKTLSNNASNGYRTELNSASTTVQHSEMHRKISETDFSLSYHFASFNRPSRLTSRYSDYTTRFITEKSWFHSRKRQEMCLFSKTSRLRPSQSPIQWVPEDIFRGVKLPKREANLSTPSSVEVKNARHCTFTSPYDFMARTRGNFSLLYLPVFHSFLVPSSVSLATILS